MREIDCVLQKKFTLLLLLFENSFKKKGKEKKLINEFYAWPTTNSP
jgi:hypothetical protein